MFNCEALLWTTNDVRNTVVFWGMVRSGIVVLTVLTAAKGDDKAKRRAEKIRRTPRSIKSVAATVFIVDRFFFSAGALSGKVLSMLAASFPLSVRLYLPWSSFDTKAPKAFR
jgi:hypothetical protein